MRKDVNEAIEQIGFARYQVVQAIALCGLCISDGAEILIASGTLPGLAKGWSIEPFMRGCLVSGIFVGVLFGNLLGGLSADALGRRPTVLAAYAGLIVAGGCSCLAQGARGLLCARLLFGVFYGMGIGPSLALQVETSPSRWRAHVVNLQYLALVVGEIFAAALLVVFMPHLSGAEVQASWRWVVGIAVLPAACLFPFACAFLQESPHYLVSNGRHAAAKHALYSMAKFSGDTETMEEMAPRGAAYSGVPTVVIAPPRLTSRTPLVWSLPQSDSEKTGWTNRTHTETMTDNSSVVDSWTTGSQEHTTFLQRAAFVLTSEYLRIVLGGAFMCFVSNLQFFGLTYALPQIFKYNSMPQVRLLPATEMLVVSCCDVPGMLLAFYLSSASEIGHRESLTTLALVSGVLMLALTSINRGTEFFWAGLPCAALAKFTGTALFGLTYAYLAEVFPSSVRATALSLCMAGGRLGSIAAPVLFEVLAVEGLRVGPHAPYMVVSALVCFAGVVVIKHTLTFELKNEPLEDVSGKTAARAAARSVDTTAAAAGGGRARGALACATAP